MQEHKSSNGFLDKYSLTMMKMGLGAALGMAVGPAIGGLGGSSVGGSGLAVGASGGGLGTGLSTAAATGGTGAGLGSGAFGAFGGASGGIGATLGSVGSYLGEAATRAGISSALGGDFKNSFLSNMIPGMNLQSAGIDLGDYTELANRSLKGAAAGGLTGGGQGALMGAVTPFAQKGFNAVGDVLKNGLTSGGTPMWEQDSFGSGGYSQVPSTLDNVFSQNGISGGQQGPMSTNAGMQSQGGGQLDWQSILGGQQGFGNTDPQQQEMQPNTFGVGMDYGQGQMPGFNVPPMQAPVDNHGFDDDFMKKYGGVLGGLGDGVKAALIASNPRYAALFGKQNMSPVGAGVGALASLFYNQKANSQLKKQANNMNLGQNSSYMKAMREQLARKDAQAGRRSQYGPREVELQAKLAEMNGRNAPTQFAIAQQRNMNNARTLQDLIGFGKQSGAFDAVGNGLKDLFS